MPWTLDRLLTRDFCIGAYIAHLCVLYLPSDCKAQVGGIHDVNADTQEETRRLRSSMTKSEEQAFMMQLHSAVQPRKCAEGTTPRGR